VRICALLAAVAFFAGADWRQFRGTDNTSAAESDLPESVGERENVRWKVELPGRGPAGPIVVGDRVIVAGSSGHNQDRLHVNCYDAGSGKQLWHRQFWATGSTLTHPFVANAGPTPASDGRRVFALFSSNDLICLDLDGNLEWLRGLTVDFPNARNDVGLSSSPVAAGKSVIVQIENQSDSFAAGIDAVTGETRWRIERNRGPNWASPAVARGAGPDNDVVLLQSPNQLTAHDADSGRQLWSYDKPCATISSPAALAGRVYVPSAGVTALEPGSSPESPKTLWTSGALQPANASIILGGEKLYALNRSGVLACAAAETGKVLWRLRLEGTHWGTPVLAGSRLYAINQDGGVQVVDVSGTRGRQVSKGSFGERILSTPAVAGDAMYVRSDRYLWKIAAAEAQQARPASQRRSK